MVSSPWRDAYVAARRLSSCVAALVVLYIEVTGSIATRTALYGAAAPAELSNVYYSPLIGPFLRRVAANASYLAALAPTPHLNVLYIDQTEPSETLTVSRTSCGNYFPSDAMYNQSYVAPLLHQLLDAQRSWHAVDLADHVVVVDCAYTGRLLNDTTALKLHLIDLTQTNVTTVFLQTMLLTRPAKCMTLSGGLANVVTSPIHGVAAPATYFHLLGIEFPFVLAPFERIALQDPSETQWHATVHSSGERVILSGTDGVYRESPAIQGNYDFYHWALPDDPQRFLEEIAYIAEPFAVDSYAWVRCLLGLGVAFNLGANCAVALLVVGHSWLSRREVWIPDLYPSIQRRIQLRSLLLLGATIATNYWHIFEYCLQNGNARQGINQGFLLHDMVRSDGLTYLLALALTLADVLQTRLCLDVVVLLYVVCVHQRLSLVTFLQWRMDETNAFLDANYVDCIVSEPGAAMTLWMYHRNTETPSYLLATELSWYVVALGLTLLYGVALDKPLRRRLWRRQPVRIAAGIANSEERSPRPAHQRWSRQSSLYTCSNDADAKDGSSLFERSTMHALAQTYGLVAPLDEYKLCGGTRKVSPSAIWLLGYIILKDEFVVELRDYVRIWANLLLPSRVFRVYCFRIQEGDTTSIHKEPLPMQGLRARDLLCHISLRPLR
ncbi:hypothetical protein SPRG_06546 [Saprolegnia parasitica CBS 223.65]|uniref:Uncharacterized protein n=1 Tax=Saprolegnia parasitica (strain CBS 223.65) TaxID=695850 RepID=A0A067CPJ0_SAPPC|nr:hypothetical protein SPRG_06546 [Saprolegnia parasitica CBS 223.65]KDO28692.1 hypothetical protein SPRG_06546 [Saprolegnia parasitica CBS 223.65]|eukprot:XP_012200750.1 hypothetical protein SPRG_06546 [Saprolegnia parasitica CBS 223.65]